MGAPNTDIDMASFLRKAARMNLVPMDFVLQVTVVELVLGSLDSEAGRMLSFELSRGTKVHKRSISKLQQ